MKKKEKFFYIYLTTNLINNKKYIGAHYGGLDDYYLGSGNEFKKAVKKYGRTNFKKEILEICSDYNDINIAERKWIKKYNAVQDKNFYNIAEGGFNSNPLAGMSEKAKEERSKKLSLAAKGKNNHFYGKHLYGSQNPRYGTHHSEESKEKMRQAKIGGKAPTAKTVSLYNENNELVKTFETQKDLKIFLGLAPNGSTDTLHKYAREHKLYHGYYIIYN